MSIPKNSSKVTSLSEMKSLLNPNEAIGLSDYVLRKAENCEPLDVAVLSSEHANCDSLPLRYCMHFQRDTVITLKRVEISRKPQYKQDRVVSVVTKFAGLLVKFRDGHQLADWAK